MKTLPMTYHYESNATMSELASLIRKAQRILVTSHAKPDGDAIGSVLALVRALKSMGKEADGWLMGPIEPSLRSLAEDTPLYVVEERQPDDSYDLVIVTDTGAWVQLEPLAPWLKKHHERVIGFDHHAGGEEVAMKRIVDTSKASVTQILVDLMDELEIKLVGDRGGVAEALFVGLATDTGWFKFQNADAEAFRVASRLLGAGVDKSRLYQVIEETAAPSRLALEARSLSSVEYFKDGTIVIMLLREEDFQATGGSLNDLTGLVNTPMQVGAVQVSILLTQVNPGTTKISFRSKPACADRSATDVNELAKHFGGGGHCHAAGARLDMNIDEAKAAILSVLE